MEYQQLTCKPFNIYICTKNEQTLNFHGEYMDMFQLIHMFEIFHNKKLNWVKLDRVELFFLKILYSLWNKNLLSTKF